MPEAQGDEFQGYIRQLKSPDVTVRSDAAHHLGRLQDERGVPALAEALQDSDEYVRKSAVAALRRIGGGEAGTALRAAHRLHRRCCHVPSSMNKQVNPELLSKWRDEGTQSYFLKWLDRG